MEQGLRAGLPYRALARQYSVSKDVVFRHRGHVPLHSTPALATLREVMVLLHQAETADTWDTTLITLKGVRHCVGELLVQLGHEIER